MNFFRADAVTVLVLLRALPGREAEAERALIAVNEQVRREPGFVRAHVSRDGRDFVVYEHWKSRTWFDGGHQKTRHLQAFYARVPDLFETDHTVRYLTPVRDFVPPTALPAPKPAPKTGTKK